MIIDTAVAHGSHADAFVAEVGGRSSSGGAYGSELSNALSALARQSLSR